MNVLLVDDHPILRFGVRQLLRREWPQAHVDEAATLKEAIRRFETREPDVVLLDLVLPDSTGVEGVAKMLAICGKVPILILSLNNDLGYAARLLKMGVAGYLPKDRAPAEIVTAVKSVLSGKRYVTTTMAAHLMGMLADKTAGTPRHELLSAQEYRVMQLIAAGTSPAEIARLMGLSVKTVGTYRARIFEKTGWKNNIELTKYCLQQGLTDAI